MKENPYYERCRELAILLLEPEPCSDDPKLMASHTESLTEAILGAVSDWFGSPDKQSKTEKR